MGGNGAESFQRARGRLPPGRCDAQENRTIIDIESAAPLRRVGEFEAPMQAARVSQQSARPRVGGKFLFVGNEKFWIKGVTYGTFRPLDDRASFPPRATVTHDFSMMAACGINSVRTYVAPPRWLLDCASDAGLHVMVGIAWEQHVTFLDDPALTRSIEESIRDGVRACADHPAVLGYCIGNEIPPVIVRWHGRRRIERFVKRLYEIAKSVDPEGLVTYANFPTTEYLQLKFLDFICFNVYLESRETFEAYISRLQNLAGDRPLVMAELGLDSRRNGDERQAEYLDSNLRSAFAEGCAGAFVFAWTDEWHRGGFDVEDWDFGITSRDRVPKLALHAVRKALADVPFSASVDWPMISVVVCSYNGASTIRDTMEGLKHLAYPNYEVIVIDDGSTDATPKIASAHAVKLISTANRGLSAARNRGWQEARGEIVVYIDDDAYPDPHWLHYLAHTFLTTDFAGVGGPNFAPPDDGPIAECVYNAPGGPVHVLIADRVAEHIPGCNMAFRRSVLEAIGGFDPRFRTAGDDVDVCWRIQATGARIGFHASALNWHHRRNSVMAYWKQQKGYGKAEALLEAKWPEKYNALGHYSWSGRVYGRGFTEALPLIQSRIYGGQWGSAPFQSLYQPAPGLLASLPLMPEWYLAVGLLTALLILGLAWAPLLWLAPLWLIGILAPIAQAALSAATAEFPRRGRTRWKRIALRVLTAGLHLLQPIARLTGRMRHGLTPWRGRYRSASLQLLPVSVAVWQQQWSDPHRMLHSIRGALRAAGPVVAEGGAFDAWDLEVRGGLAGRARIKMAYEDHAGGAQLFRFRVWPSLSAGMLALPAALLVATAFVALDRNWIAATVLGVLSLTILLALAADVARAISCTHGILRRLEGVIERRKSQAQRRAPRTS